MDVTLEQMLSAREKRAEQQYMLNRKYALPLLSFTLNIPGPAKNSPLIRRAFHAGLVALTPLIPPELIRERIITDEVTGCEGLFAVDMDAKELKRITTAVEDSHPLGRLFDLDVLDRKLNKLDRDLVNGGDRGCLVCGAPGRDCASRRLHSVEELQKAVHRKLVDYFSRSPDFHTVGTWAALSLLDEVSVTPKPGLVDRNNSGSHRDMNLHTFVSSTAALVPYFRRCVQIGWETRHQEPEESFLPLRKAGIAAEEAMFRATGGVNTHKGAIFTLGILCGAVGRHWDSLADTNADMILQTAADMVHDAMIADFSHMTKDTAGGRFYLDYGIKGIRGEAASGFPAIGKTGLPIFRHLVDQYQDWNKAGAITLLHLIAEVEDTNMISRGGISLAAEARDKAAALLPCPSLSEIEELDRWFMERNLSPGGCADLLAAICFLRRLNFH